MASTKPLVLLTGATGFVGFLTLLELLKTGFRVNAVVRSQAKADNIRTNPVLKALDHSDHDLTFTVISDMAAPGAFNEAVQGATYVIHLAAPVPSFTGQVTVTSDQYQTYFVDNLVSSHTGMLESAASTNGSVRRVVLINSVMAVIPFAYFTGAPENDYSVTFTAESRIPVPTGPFWGEFDAYAAGKVAALKAAEDWMAKNGDKAGLDLITVLPAAVFGRDEQVSSVAELRADGTNSVLVSLLLGNKGEFPHNGNAVLGTDVAKTNVRALDPKVKGNQSFITSRAIVYEDALEVLRRDFAAEVKEGKLSADGKQPTLAISTDASKTEEALGFTFATFEEIVKQVAGQYLEFLSKA